MKKIVLMLALIVAVGSGFAWSHQYGSQSQQRQPQKPSQEITLYYSQMDVGMAESLGCLSTGTGWLCHLTGAGGGGHSYPD